MRPSLLGSGASTFSESTTTHGPRRCAEGICENVPGTGGPPSATPDYSACRKLCCECRHLFWSPDSHTSVTGPNTTGQIDLSLYLQAHRYCHRCLFVAVVSQCRWFYQRFSHFHNEHVIPVTVNQALFCTPTHSSHIVSSFGASLVSTFYFPHAGAPTGP